MPFNTTPIGFAYADMELNGTNLVNVPTTGADKGVGIGAGVSAETALEIGGTYPTSGGNTNVTRSIGTIPSGTTTAARIYDSSPSTEASAFTLTTLQHYRAQQGTLGAGSAVTTQVGFIANSTLTGATNNYGFQSSINEGANRYNLYMSGSADNLITGRLGIGGNPNAAYKVRITGTLPSSANVTWVMNADGTIPSTSTTAAITYSSEVGTQAASFTCASLQHFRVNQGAFGAGSSVTNQYGFLVQSTMTGATNNYGFLSDLAAGTGRWGFYANGTAANFFNGTNNGFGTVDAAVRLTVRGVSSTSADYSFVCQNSSVVPTFYVRNDGLFSTGTAPSSPYNAVIASAANVFIDGNGILYRSTSSSRYKTNIVNAAHGLADVLKLRSVTYNGINNGDTVFGGLIAEEVHDAGLTEFVLYDKEGRPDALHYGNMVALLVKAVQELEAKVAALEAK